MMLQVLAVLVLGLLCGNELSVAVFTHPTLHQQPRESHVRLRAAFAAVFGRVMPFWMGGSTLLSLLLLLPFAHLTQPAWRLAAIAAGLQVAAVIFSLAGPVPINNRTAKWTPESLPDDWKAQERIWDLYHWIRTGGLIVAFALLVCSVRFA